MGKYAEILANPDYGPYIAHPAADMFPLMTEDEFAALAEDIKEHGQQEPIILLMQEGGTKRLLDGRNRYLACKAAGVEPKFIIKFDIDPWTYVVSKNLRRRHLTREQRDAVIAKLREQGHTIREIAAETGTARATVADAVKRVDDVSETGHVGPETRTDSKGRRQPTRKSRAQRKAGGHSPEQQAKADGIKQAKAEVMITAGKQQAEPIEGKLLEGKPLPRLADLEKGTHPVWPGRAGPVARRDQRTPNRCGAVRHDRGRPGDHPGPP